MNSGENIIVFLVLFFWKCIEKSHNWWNETGAVTMTQNYESTQARETGIFWCKITIKNAHISSVDAGKISALLSPFFSTPSYACISFVFFFRPRDIPALIGQCKKRNCSISSICWTIENHNIFLSFQTLFCVCFRKEKCNWKHSLAEVRLHATRKRTNFYYPKRY